MFEAALELAKADNYDFAHYWALKILSSKEIFDNICRKVKGCDEEKKKIQEAYDNGTNLKNLNDLWNRFHCSEKIFNYLNSN